MVTPTIYLPPFLYLIDSPATTVVITEGYQRSTSAEPSPERYHYLIWILDLTLCAARKDCMIYKRIIRVCNSIDNESSGALGAARDTIIKKNMRTTASTG